MEQIDFKAKSDRELLILVVQRSNDIVRRLEILDNSVAAHSREIASIKGKIQGRCDDKPRHQVLKDNWQFWTAVACVIFGVVYGIGKAAGWW